MPAPTDAFAQRVDQIDALLPQTQCTQCGFAGCRPYAQAIVDDEVPLNRCPPGGQAGADRLAGLLGQPTLALDLSRGLPGPRRVARIDAQVCIGCTKCITACPVDAIIGATRRLHHVIDDLCSGCDLCVPACPVDCIVMEPAATPWTPDDATAARQRHQARARRLVREERDDRVRLARKASDKLEALSDAPADADTARKRAVIEAAIRRARERLAGTPVR